MIAAICLEDRNGLLFNGRRLSRDRAQQEDLMTVCGAGRLWISPFSAPLFAPWRERLVIAEDFYTGPDRVRYALWRTACCGRSWTGWRR